MLSIKKTKKKSYKLARTPKQEDYFNKYVLSCEIPQLEMTYFALCKKGYGSLKEVREFDTNEIIQMLEYEYLLGALEFLEYESAKEERN